MFDVLTYFPSEAFFGWFFECPYLLKSARLFLKHHFLWLKDQPRSILFDKTCLKEITLKVFYQMHVENIPLGYLLSMASTAN